MKLFYIIASVGRHGPYHVHVHANNAAEAYGIGCGRFGQPHAWVYDIGQTALCPCVLDLDTVPREEFNNP